MMYRRYGLVLGWLMAWASVSVASDPNDMFTESRTRRRQFARHSVAAVADSPAIGQGESLEALIEQVLALVPPVEAMPSRPRRPSSLIADAAGADEDDRVSKAARPGPSDDSTVAASKPARQADAHGGCSVRLMKMLSAIDDPQSVPHPMELADILYRAGLPEQAARYYQAALKETSEQESSRHAWLLFQLGGCLRNAEPQRAVLYYEELIQTYPASAWAAAAQARLDMLNWLETHQSAIQMKTASRSENE